jgi:hypothetical protein
MHAPETRACYAGDFQGDEMRRYCYRCETRLRLSELRCPYCRKSAMSWLQVGVITAFAAAAFFYLLRVI